MYFPQKYDHIRLQGRPHEKEFKLFLNTKVNATKVGTEKEDENLGFWLFDLLLFILCFSSA